MCTFIRNCQIVFRNGYFILHLSQKCMGVSVALHFGQHLTLFYWVSSGFNFHFSVFSDVEQVFMCLLPFFWWSVSLHLLLISCAVCLTADLWFLYVLKVANIFSWYVCVCARAHSVVSLCLTLPPGSSVHGIFQARILEQVAVSFSRGSSLLRGGTRVSRVWFFPSWATKGAVSQYCDLHFHFLGCVF